MLNTALPVTTHLQFTSKAWQFNLQNTSQICLLLTILRLLPVCVNVTRYLNYTQVSQLGLLHPLLTLYNPFSVSGQNHLKSLSTATSLLSILQGLPMKTITMAYEALHDLGLSLRP